MNTELQQKIEAILFYTAEEVEVKKLAKILDVAEEEIVRALNELSKTLEGRGVRLVQNAGTVLLASAPEYSETIEKMIKEERESTLGRAGIETLSIIAYKGPLTKKEIEYIRGVNSDYALRSLLLRGLAQKVNSETDMRAAVYTVTTDTLLHLGIHSIGELPEYSNIKKQLEIKEEEGTPDADEHGE